MTLTRIEIAKPGLSIWVDDQKYEFPAVVPTLDLVEKLFRHLNEPCQVTIVERSYFRFQFQDVEIVIHD
jgi:hypothetical protein